MKKIIYVMGIALFLFGACQNGQEEIPQLINKAGTKAVGPYFSADNQGNPVLCWTEQNTEDSLYRLKYAVYDAHKSAFGPSVTVATSAGCSIAAESMGKVAFKSDGTVVAVFSKRFPNQPNPYAGAIYYSVSTDKGKNWSAATYLHSDTTHAYGRSFFDVAVLKDGELAAIWLDGRFGKHIKGSALFFARTEKSTGFGQDTCLEKGTCECCRTDILTDTAGNIHLAYRDIMFPSALSEKQVRDMVYKVSTDQGRTFSPAMPISKDNWEIEGCPHSGPSLTAVGNTLHALWFTAGGGAGLYYCATKVGSGKFSNRSLISAEGRHPQMVSLKDGRLAMVFEETTTSETPNSQHEMKMEHSKGSMKMSHGPASSAKIVLALRDAKGEQQLSALSAGDFADNHAVLQEASGQLLVAWVREIHGGSNIYCLPVKLKQ